MLKRPLPNPEALPSSSVCKVQKLQRGQNLLNQAMNQMIVCSAVIQEAQPETVDRWNTALWELATEMQGMIENGMIPCEHDRAHRAACHSPLQHAAQPSANETTPESPMLLLRSPDNLLRLRSPPYLD